MLGRQQEVAALMRDKGLVHQGAEGPSRLQPTGTEPTDFSRWWFSQNQVRLLQGSRFSIGEIDLKDLPGSLAQTLRDDSS